MYPPAVEALLDSDGGVFKARRLDATFPVADGAGGLGPAIRKLADAAAEAVAGGASILIVSDRSVGPQRAPIPSLLALGAVHHRLIAEHTRQQASIVIASGDARDVHSVACL